MNSQMLATKENVAVVFEECPKLHLTTGLRKGGKANKNALLLNCSTLAFLFRKPTTLAKMPLRSSRRIGTHFG